MIRWLTKRFWPRLWSAMTKWQRDDGLTWSASLAYYGALSFFPLILVIISGFGYVLRFSEHPELKQSQLVKLISDQTSPTLKPEIEKILSGVQTNAGTSGPIGLATLVLAAIGIFMQLEAAFDRIWKVNGNGGAKRTLFTILRTVLYTRLRAFLMLLGVGAIVIAAFVLNMVVFALIRFAKELGLPVEPVLFHFIQLAVSAFLNGLMFTLIYRVIPKPPVPWRQAIGGGLVAGIAWEIGRQLLTFVIVNKSYTAYGVIGSFIILMLWFYYAGMVLLFGAEFVEVGSDRSELPA